MKKIYKPEELWPWLDQLGDQQSFYLLEQFVPGSVFHVDSIISERAVVFAEAHAYGTPPLDTSHHGGVFTTGTLPRDAEETRALLKINRVTCVKTQVGLKPSKVLAYSTKCFLLVCLSRMVIA